MSAVLASDDSNREFVGARNPDDILNVTFYVLAVQNNWRTNLEGHPIFEDQQWVRIMIPGRNDTVIEKPVEERDKQRFPRHWAHFKNMTADSENVVGTPVAEWPFLTRAQAEELRANKFYSVEQVANCSDAQIQSLGMNANLMRTKARSFLESAKNSATADLQAAEIAKRTQELEAKEAEIAALKAGQQGLAEQIANMTNLIASLQRTPAKKKAAKQEKPPRKPLSEERKQALRDQLAAARAARLALPKQPETA